MSLTGLELEAPWGFRNQPGVPRPGRARRHDFCSSQYHLFFCLSYFSPGSSDKIDKRNDKMKEEVFKRGEEILRRGKKKIPQPSPAPPKAKN